MRQAIAGNEWDITKSATTQIMAETESNKKKPDLSSFNKFIDEFGKETDRAAVVLGAAKLDLLLYQIIELFLLPAPGGRDELLDTDGPLGTFSSKIHIAYRLGLIDTEFSRTLHRIRKIRNSFAHEVDGCSLESGTHRDRVRELSAPLRRYSGYDKAVEVCKKEWNLSGSRLDFRIALGIVAARLESLFQEGKRISTGTTWPLIPEGWTVKETNNKPGPMESIKKS
jgi:hypothetical protein